MKHARHSPTDRVSPPLSLYIGRFLRCVHERIRPRPIHVIQRCGSGTHGLIIPNLKRSYPSSAEFYLRDCQVYISNNG
ncbi:hypothetical protein PILCRDRAFT_810449 [Piloderma croceum F 1598]|uniref:Uncharacterized protein n=1 Tax=Piloderma croceum (strain F 1598) TaxID=765440 RepID=A0A0C3GLD2_PILCF|nr:hypothetical protein PILCRDRAFT_810449 [Piloderma croceum F 1598]